MALYALGDLEPRIDPTAYVHPLAVVIGNVELGPEASVWPHAVLRGDDGLIRIGARSNVQDGAVIHCTPNFPTIVGDDCTVGHLAHLEGCTVYDGSLIGVGSVVLHDVRIGPHALVGANATVDRPDGGAPGCHGPGNPGPASVRTPFNPAATSTTPTCTPSAATTTAPSSAAWTDRRGRSRLTPCPRRSFGQAWSDPRGWSGRPPAV